MKYKKDTNWQPKKEWKGQFKRSLAFLSNFYPCDIEFELEIYPTLEHAYQAAKTINIEEREEIKLSETPGKAKQLGRKITLRSDWESVRLDIMEGLLRQKFSQASLGLGLLNTADELLVELNEWHDTFWGKCTCKKHNGEGENQLGILLIKIKTELKTGKTRYSFK